MRYDELRGVLGAHVGEAGAEDLIDGPLNPVLNLIFTLDRQGHDPDGDFADRPDCQDCGKPYPCETRIALDNLDPAWFR